MIRRKKGQDFTEENELHAKEKSEKHSFRLPFGKKKKEEEQEFNLYTEDIQYIGDDEDFDQEAYEKDVQTIKSGIKHPEDGDTAEKTDGVFSDASADVTDSGEKGQDEEEDILENEKETKKISKKKLLLVAGAAVVIVGAVSYFMMKNISGGDLGKAYVESVRVIAGLGSANGMNNRYTGEVEAQDSWNITLQSEMSVKECFVSVGDQVKKGDKLFSYDTDELKLSQEKKELEVETLQNEITQLNKDIKSYQDDLKSASASEKIELQTQILTAQTTIKKDEYSVKSGKEEIETIKKNITDATVTSKMDGVVKSINASLGQSSSDDESDMSDSSGDGSAYMTILAVGDYRVKGKISETNVWSINEGDPVIVRSRVDETTWKGTISKVNTDSTADTEGSSDDTMDMDYSDSGDSGDSASSYNFYVELNDDEGLMMGQHVFVEIDYGQDEEEDGIWIPSAYIKVDGEKYYVWAANRRNRLELREISVGEYNEELDEYQVLDGIDADDYIACDDENLQENMKTTKVESEEDSTGDYLDEEMSDDEIYDESDYEDYEDYESYDEEDLSDSDFIDEDYSDDGLMGADEVE